MPGKDGFATCQEIRANPKTKHIPVLMATGLDNSESILRAFEAGATDFISKPVKPELLIYRIRYILRASATMNKLTKSEASLVEAQQVAKIGNWEWNPLTGTVTGSAGLSLILGKGHRKFSSTFEEFLSAVHPQDKDMVARALHDTVKNRSVCNLEYHIRIADKELRTVKIRGRAKLTTSGKISLISGILQDITEMRQVEERLVMLKEAVDCLPIGITLINTEGKIVYSNPAEAVMHGYVTEELIGMEARNFAPEGARLPKMAHDPSKLGMWERESVNIKRSGEQFPVKLTSIAVTNTAGKYLGMVTACEDITSRKEAEKTITDLAYFDTLTNLPNRRMFLDRLRHAVAMGQRHRHMVGLYFIDLDDFKDINDTKGHDFGDKMLREVAKRMSSIVRESETLARLGGDEFVVIMTVVNHTENLVSAAQRISNMFHEPFMVEDQEVFCNASIGIALYPGDAVDADTLVKCADTAMYFAKEKGKSQYKFYSSEMNQRIMRRVALEKSLRQALEKQEFLLHYQPKWDLKTGRMTGVEVLLRWQSSDFGFMLPAEFISLTENSGLITKIGEWVLHTACSQARKWIDAGHCELKVAVNISGHQLKDAGFLDMVVRIIRETGIEPNVLELEFTENVVMESTEKNINTLMALRQLGVQLSIDDFGTGYSCLSNLKHFSIDKVKIDRSFMEDVHRSKDDAAIVEAIISMAHSLNLKVIAEGVETRDQLHFLQQRECDEVQGFYMAKPMTAGALTSTLTYEQENPPGIMQEESLSGLFDNVHKFETERGIPLNE
jgi:diguanylate cyclase (GGDEF)-like protein/PAS domain S-box-containing protein